MPQPLGGRRSEPACAVCWLPGSSSATAPGSRLDIVKAPRTLTPASSELARIYNAVYWSVEHADGTPLTMPLLGEENSGGFSVRLAQKPSAIAMLRGRY